MSFAKDKDAIVPLGPVNAIHAAPKWPRPFGLRPKNGHAALLVVHLELPNFSPRALPGRFWGSNAAAWIALTGPDQHQTPVTDA
jgi:hypothetical protein